MPDVPSIPDFHPGSAIGRRILEQLHIVGSRTAVGVVPGQGRVTEDQAACRLLRITPVNVVSSSVSSRVVEKNRQNNLSVQTASGRYIDPVDRMRIGNRKDKEKSRQKARACKGGA